MSYRYAVGRILDHFPDLKTDDVICRLRQSTFVSVPKRYMYFEVPKAACTQMKALLRTIEDAPPIKLFADGKTWETRREMFVHARSNVPLPSLLDLDDRTQREVFEAPDFLRMTVVRNPYTRLVSAWRGKVLLCEPTGRRAYLQVKGHLPGIHEDSLISFGEFVEYVEKKCDLRACDPHWRRQVDYTFFPAMNFSCVARLEQLQEGLRVLEQHLRLSESLVAAGKNASLPVGIASYTEELADKVYSLYRADFEELRYDRNTWAACRQDPSQQPRYGSISEERLRDEIIERNLIILGLYEERERLQTQLRWVSRLRLLPAPNGWETLRLASRRVVRDVKRWLRRVFSPRRVVKRGYPITDRLSQ
jgi:hypothetical protein